MRRFLLKLDKTDILCLVSSNFRTKKIMLKFKIFIKLKKYGEHLKLFSCSPSIDQKLEAHTAAKF